MLDPFLLLDDFHSNNPADYIAGFPWHPHRGIETITYMLEGSVEHGDSMGNSGKILPGDVQWMTAGSGIIHQEMPKGGANGEMHGFQLWANLPALDKMIKPKYRDVKAGMIPEVIMPEGTKVKVVCGNVRGIEGPVNDIVTAPEYLDVTVPPGCTFKHEIKHGHTVFAYVFEGAGYFDGRENTTDFDFDPGVYTDLKKDSLIRPEMLVVYGEGSVINVKASGAGVRFLLVSGKPLKEPIAWYGPIVMNTREELRQAFDEYESGNFIK
jgi:redox-sensitive bicupin YhaK (pirin superfamily)